MSYQQEHLPKVEPSREEELWPFDFWIFIEERWPYLLGILLVIFIFWFARNQWDKRNKQ